MPLTITTQQLDDAAAALMRLTSRYPDWTSASNTQRRRAREDVMRLLIALGQHDFRIADIRPPDPAEQRAARAALDALTTEDLDHR